MIPKERMITTQSCVESRFNASSFSNKAGEEIPRIPVFEFLFSNPFVRDSPIIQRSPSKSTQEHFIPRIPPSTTIFSDLSQESSIGWEDLRDESLAISCALNNHLGLWPPKLTKSTSKKGSIPSTVLSPVVMVHLPNGIPMALLTLGALAAGLTVTTVNPDLGAGELNRIIRVSKPAVIFSRFSCLSNVFSAISCLEVDYDELKKRLRRHIYIIDHEHYQAYWDSHKAPDSPHLIPPVLDWKGLINHNDPCLKNYQPFKFTDPEFESKARIALIFWSSGTSGNAKGVARNHYATVSSLVSLWHLLLEMESHERIAGVVPFFHVLGLQNILLFSITIGATVYILPKYRPRDFLEMITKKRITLAFIAPPIAEFLAHTKLLDNRDVGSKYNIRSLKNITCGGAALAPKTVKRVYEKTGVLILQGYGLSELGPVSHQKSYSWNDYEFHLGSVGDLLYGVEIKIVNVEDRKPTNKGSEGEILVKSSAVMNLYLGDETESRSVFDNSGWFKTGDLGKLDCYNRLWLTGRLKDVIKVKGFQVSPLELEDLILQLDGVESVGVGSKQKADSSEEFPTAYIIPKYAELKNFIKPYQLSSYKKLMFNGEFDNKSNSEVNKIISISRKVKNHIEGSCINYKWLKGGIVFVENLPISPSGKLNRRLLKNLKGLEIDLYPSQVEKNVLNYKLMNKL
ncbi:long-chain-fatty-acid-CoA ligase [Phakopsora pachyrhizi]|uniref:Long-chain-fatty-acid-CoA ligase n=1 Tax=Phakopsora pachyrhizi TaxID=170000 RepID=A0AAV0B193_PHAPC|nr:long-chain-fatty-acid-CoA ligase [Phakopsora pachyrhizi]CAH7675443.1 long-chain-fatty-acid-CoA ligase [Phakopsora pachyrhizi]